MQVRLVQLLSDGVRRPREQCKADPGVCGTLTLELITQNVAELLRITPKGLWLRGFQFNSSSGECIQDAEG